MSSTVVRHLLYSQLHNPAVDTAGYAALVTALTFTDHKQKLTYQFYHDSGFFLSGFLNSVQDYFAQRQLPVVCQDSYVLPQRQIVTDSLWDKLPESQQWAVGRFINCRGGIAKLPTRFGKTYVMAGVYHYTGRPTTLVLVPTTEILKQAQEELSDFLGERVGAIGAGKIDPQNLTFALPSALLDLDGGEGWPVPRSQFLSYFNAIQAVVWDEIQLHGRMFVSINEACKNAVYRHGYSATPFSGKTWWDATAIGYLGPLVCDVPSIVLAATGRIEYASVFFWQHASHPIGDTLDWHTYYKDNIVNNTERNHLIAQIVKSYTSRGKSIIVFAEQVTHLRKLSKLIPGSVILAAKIREQNKLRHQIKDDFNAKKILCVIVTKIWKLGVTLYADAALNAGAGKQGEAGHNEIQMLGRGLMPKGETFQWNDIFDTSGQTCTLGKLGQHSQHRLSTLLREGWPSFIITQDSVAHRVESVADVQKLLLPNKDSIFVPTNQP